MSVNKVILIGNTTKEPDIRQTHDGREIASFSLATNEKWTNKHGEKQEKVEYHKIVVFGNLAGIVKSYVRKGSKLYIEGQLQTRKWTDNSGVEKYTTEIVLQGFNSSLQLLDSREKQERPIDGHNQSKANGYQNEYQNSQSNSDNFGAEENIDDDLPF